MKKLKADIPESIKSKKINVFFLFLFLAFLILIFTKLSREHTDTITFNIDKVNVPEEIVILNDSSQNLDITIKTHGFKWLKYYLTKPKITIDFSRDVNKTGKTFIWTKDKAYVLANQQFRKQVELLNLEPDTLFFKFDEQMVKKVPVVLNTNINFDQGFDMLSAFELKPDSIQVIGPNILVSKIKSIQTDTLTLTEVKSSINEAISLQLPENNSDLKFSNKSVNVTANVEKFTEGTLKVPVEIKNVPKSIKIKFFPKEVTLAYYTSLNNFNTVSEEDFVVQCDYKKVKADQSFLIPELVKKSDLVKNVKINQQHIDFIITE